MLLLHLCKNCKAQARTRNESREEAEKAASTISDLEKQVEILGFALNEAQKDRNSAVDLRTELETSFVKVFGARQEAAAKDSMKIAGFEQQVETLQRAQGEAQKALGRDASRIEELERQLATLQRAQGEAEKTETSAATLLEQAQAQAKQAQDDAARLQEQVDGYPTTLTCAIREDNERARLIIEIFVTSQIDVLNNG